MQIDQSVIDRAVKMATAAALDGTPVERLIWNPPVDAAQSPYGCWTIILKDEKWLNAVDFYK